MSTLSKSSHLRNIPAQNIKKKKKKARPEWDSTVTDVSQYKATTAEIERRKLTHLSKNKQIAKVDLMKRNLSDDRGRCFFTPSALNVLPANIRDQSRRPEDESPGWMQSTPDRSQMVLQEILDLVGEGDRDSECPPTPQNQSMTTQLTSFTSKLLTAVEKLTRLHVTMRDELNKEKELRTAIEQDLESQRELCQAMVTEMVRLNEQQQLLSSLLLTGEISAATKPACTLPSISNVCPPARVTSKAEHSLDYNEPEDPLISWIDGLSLDNKENQPSSNIVTTSAPVKSSSNRSSKSTASARQPNSSLINRTSSPIPHSEFEQNTSSSSWFHSLRQSLTHSDKIKRHSYPAQMCRNIPKDIVSDNFGYVEDTFPAKDFEHTTPVRRPMREINNLNETGAAHSSMSCAILLSTPRQQSSERAEFWS